MKYIKIDNEDYTVYVSRYPYNLWVTGKVVRHSDGYNEATHLYRTLKFVCIIDVWNIKMRTGGDRHITSFRFSINGSSVDVWIDRSDLTENQMKRRATKIFNHLITSIKWKKEK